MMLKKLLTVFLLSNLCVPLHAELPASSADTAERSQLDTAVAQKADWIADAQKCPANLMPNQNKKEEIQDNHCYKHSEGCLAECDAGQAGACYWLAQRLINNPQGKPETYEPLFQRSCKLGITSGCTNHAAYLDNTFADDATYTSCIVETYQKGCDLNDPWACTMYALHAIPSGLQALSKSCLNIEILSQWPPRMKPVSKA